MKVQIEARYFRITNWDKFQHYKQRNPPWIRLHRTLLRDHKFGLLSETEQWTLVRLWLLASETGNAMAMDDKWVRKAISSSRPVPFEKYAAMGFIETWCEQDASAVLAERKQSAEPEADSSEAEQKNIEGETGDVDKSTAEFFAFAAKVGLTPKQKLRALQVPAEVREEAMRVTASMRPEKPAAYFSFIVKKVADNAKEVRSTLPLLVRLEEFVRNAGHHYDDSTLTEELTLKGADPEMVGRLLRLAAEERHAA